LNSAFKRSHLLSCGSDAYGHATWACMMYRLEDFYELIQLTMLIRGSLGFKFTTAMSRKQVPWFEVFLLFCVPLRPYGDMFTGILAVNPSIDSEVMEWKNTRT